MSPSLPSERFASFEAFYPFYLSEHSKAWTRRFHFVGTTLAVVTGAVCVVKETPETLWLVPVIGYGFAWLSHTFIEHNKPATFQYPFYSLLGDFRMFSEMLQGKRWTNNNEKST
jgi:hypothetical protein